VKIFTNNIPTIVVNSPIVLIVENVGNRRSIQSRHASYTLAPSFASNRLVLKKRKFINSKIFNLLRTPSTFNAL
jgi:hypothetical protein